MLLGVIAAAVVLLVAGIGLAIFAASGSDYTVGSCVARSGDAAKPVDCSTSGAYKITKKVTSQKQCADQRQPVVILSTKGKPDEVLCLEPSK